MNKIIMQTDSITWTSSLPDIHVRMSRSIMCIPATTTVTVLLTLNVRCSKYNSTSTSKTVRHMFSYIAFNYLHIQILL